MECVLLGATRHSTFSRNAEVPKEPRQNLDKVELQFSMLLLECGMGHSSQEIPIPSRIYYQSVFWREMGIYRSISHDSHKKAWYLRSGHDLQWESDALLWPTSLSFQWNPNAVLYQWPKNDWIWFPNITFYKTSLEHEILLVGWLLLMWAVHTHSTEHRHTRAPGGTPRKGSPVSGLYIYQHGICGHAYTKCYYLWATNKSTQARSVIAAIQKHRSCPWCFLHSNELRWHIQV